LSWRNGPSRKGNDGCKLDDGTAQCGGFWWWWVGGTVAGE